MDNNENENLRCGMISEEELSEKWEHLGISNDFIFGKVMQDEELLAELVRMVLPELKFKKLKVHAQYTVEAGMDIHDVRFDVYATSEKEDVVEIEMQVINTGYLPQRLRFYSSMADSMMLEKGVVYSKLQNAYIILICPFDAYGLGLHKYTFKNLCVEHQGLEMGDGTEKVVLNALGTENDVDSKLKAFLDYVAGDTVDDEYAKKVDEAVLKARQNKEWRKEYMTLIQRDLENRELGREEGMAEGRKAGRKEGRKEERKEMILNMLGKGQTPEQISFLTDVPVDVIKSIEAAALQMA